MDNSVVLVDPQELHDATSLAISNLTDALAQIGETAKSTAIKMRFTTLSSQFILSDMTLLANQYDFVNSIREVVATTLNSFLTVRKIHAFFDIRRVQKHTLAKYLEHAEEYPEYTDWDIIDKMRATLADDSPLDEYTKDEIFRAKLTWTPC